MLAAYLRRSYWVTLSVTGLCGWLLVGTTHGQDDLFGESEPAAAAPGATGETAETPAAPEQSPEEKKFNEDLTQAEEQMNQGNWGAAAEALGRLVNMTRDPRYYTRVLIDQGVCYKNLGSSELAITAYSNAQSQLASPMAQQALPGKLEMVLLERGKLYLEVNRPREAFDDFGQARALNPTSAQANFLSGKALLRKVIAPGSAGGGSDQAAQNDLQQAVKYLEQAIRLDANAGDAYLERARVLARLRQSDLAVTDLEQAVKLLGANSEAGAELGVALTVRAQNQTFQANPNYEKMVSDWRVGIDAMNTYLKSASLGVKDLPWQNADVLKPHPEKIMLQAMDASLSLGSELNNSESPALYQSVTDNANRLLAADLSDEDKARCYYLRGVSRRLQNDLTQAISDFTLATQTYELSAGVVFPEGYLRRGICYYHQNQLDLALQDFERAASSPGTFSYESRAMFWAGATRARLGDTVGAIRSYTRSIAGNSHYLPAYLNRGLAYMSDGRYDQALEDFNFVVRNDPANVDAQRYRDQAFGHLAN